MFGALKGVMLGLALAVVASVGPAAADKIEISKYVYENYQDYLKQISSFSVAVFAVSQDGNDSYYVYCSENCSMGSLAKQALDECSRKASGKPCKIMAANRDLRIEFEVFESSKKLSSNDEILAHRLPADELKRRVEGNTIRGEYPNGRKWVEFYDPKGEIRGKDDKKGSYSARYTFNGDKLCFDYPDNDGDWCAQVSEGSGQAYFIDASSGELVTFIRNASIVTGNPDNL
jgi:hypothetical protein